MILTDNLMTRTMIITAAAAAAVTDWCAGERSSSLRNITSPLSSAFLLMILSDMIRYYQILSNIIWHYLIWSDIIWYHQISSDIIWNFLISSDIFWYHWLLQHQLTSDLGISKFSVDLQIPNYHPTLLTNHCLLKCFVSLDLSARYRQWLHGSNN